MKTKSVKKQYLDDINRKLNTSSKESKRFIRILEHNIDNYLLENPSSTYFEIEDNFGGTDSVVESFLDSLNSDELVHQISFKKKIAITIISTVIILSIICGGIYAWHYHNLNKELPAYTVEEIKEIN